MCSRHGGGARRSPRDGTGGREPNTKAPPFRAIAARHPVLALREPLLRGIAAPHDEMPNF